MRALVTSVKTSRISEYNGKSFSEIIEGILVKNDVKYDKEKKDIEYVEYKLHEPRELRLPILYNTVIKAKIVFEDEDEKNILKKKIVSATDESVTIELHGPYNYSKYYEIILPRGFEEKNEVEATIKPHGTIALGYNVFDEINKIIERELGKLEKTYTIRVSRRIYERLREIGADKVREALEILVANGSVESPRNLKSCMNEKKWWMEKAEEYEKKIAEREEELAKTKEKIKTLVEFLEEKELLEDYKQWLIEKEKEKHEEELKRKIEEELNEYIENEDEDYDP